MEKLSGRGTPSINVPYPIAFAAAFALEIKGNLFGSDPGITVNGLRTVKHPWFFDSSKAEKTLDHKPRAIEETLVDAIDWHRRRMQ